jgi:pimeloyl-ACP methyl ester carboxylesterase
VAAGRHRTVHSPGQCFLGASPLVSERQGRSPTVREVRFNAWVTGKQSILLLHGVQSSQLTWWRLKTDLGDLGWRVHAVDLLGHGSRHADGPDSLSMDDLARDVLAQVAGPVDVLAGHSLGSIVALTLAGLAPGYCHRVVIEDPPGLSGSLDLREVAGDVEESVRVARADPAGTVVALLEDNPVWSRRDAENSVQNRLNLDLVRVARLLRTTRWDLQGLVRDCPVPVQLLAATRGSALVDPDRSALMAQLPTDHVALIESGHTIHRERPGLWLHYVLELADGLGYPRSGHEDKAADRPAEAPRRSGRVNP